VAGEARGSSRREISEEGNPRVILTEFMREEGLWEGLYLIDGR